MSGHRAPVSSACTLQSRILNSFFEMRLKGIGSQKLRQVMLHKLDLGGLNCPPDCFSERL